MRKFFAALAVVVLGMGPASAAEVNPCECPKVERTVIKVCVDATRTLDQLVADGRYDWVNSDITKHFSIEPGNGAVPTDIILVHFGRTMTTDQVLAEMERLNLRPATLRELLSLGAQHPELQREFPIAALGTVQRVYGYRYVAYLHRSGAKRDLFLFWFDDGWYGHCRFAAVRK